MAELGHLAGLNSVVSSTRADGQAIISIEQGALLGAVIGVVLGWPEYTRAPWQVAIDIVIGDALLGAAVVAIACRILFGNRKP